MSVMFPFTKDESSLLSKKTLAAESGFDTESITLPEIFVCASMDEILKQKKALYNPLIKNFFTIRRF